MDRVRSIGFGINTNLPGLTPSASSASQFQAPLNALNATRHQPLKQKKILADMLRIIAEDLVPDRRLRSEPRVLKRRPKSYQRLTQPRAIMKVAFSRRNKGKYQPKAALS